jgi:hypothetical protein
MDLPPRRNGYLVPGIVFAALCALGGAGVALAGRIGRAGPVPNIAFVIGGGVLAALGVRAIQTPTSLQVVDVKGMDAFGRQQYGNGRAATAAQGTVAGIVCLVAGIGVTLLGVLVPFSTGR